MTNGSLSPSEFSERSEKAVMAKTFGDLDELVDDLPVAQLDVVLPSWPPAPDTGVGRTGVNPASGRRVTRQCVAVLSGADIGATAAVGDHLTATAVMGGVEIDLRSVEFTAAELTIRCFALMGGIDIIVPDDVTLEIDGVGIMGGFPRQREQVGRPGAPVVRVVGVALMGGVDAKPKPRDAK